MRLFLCIAAAVSLLISHGCSKEEAAPPEGQIADSPEESPQPVEPAPEVTPKTQIEGVADLSLALVAPEQIKMANKENSAALKHHKKKAWSEAIAAYQAGLSANPGHILLRYNLGCAYAMDGQRDNALAILKQFKETPACLLCVGRLQRATKDSDFKSLWKDAEFQELTAGAEMTPPDYKAITRTFLTNMGKASWGLLKRGVDTGHGFVHLNEPAPKLEAAIIDNGSALAKWKLALGGSGAEFHPGDTYTYKLKCRGSCCSVWPEEENMDSSYGEYQSAGSIDSVCYWPVSADEAYVHTLSVTLNPIFAMEDE